MNKKEWTTIEKLYWISKNPISKQIKDCKEALAKDKKHHGYLNNSIIERKLTALKFAQKVINKALKADDVQWLLDSISMIDALYDVWGYGLLISPHNMKVTKREHELLKELHALDKKHESFLNTPMNELKKTGQLTQDEYRTLAKVAHPDKGGSDEAMAILNNMYDKDGSPDDRWKKYNEDKRRIETEINEVRESEFTEKKKETTDKVNRCIDIILSYQ